MGNDSSPSVASCRYRTTASYTRCELSSAECARIARSRPCGTLHFAIKNISLPGLFPDQGVMKTRGLHQIVSGFDQRIAQRLVVIFGFVRAPEATRATTGLAGPYHLARRVGD